MFSFHVEADELGFGSTELIRKLIFRIAANHDHAVHVRTIAEHVACNVVERLRLAGLGVCKQNSPMAFVIVEGVNDFLGGGDLVRVSHDWGDFFLDFLGDFLNRDDSDGSSSSSINISGNSLLSENGILVLFAGFMARAVALVISTSTGPFASTSVDGAHGDRTTGRRRR